MTDDTSQPTPTGSETQVARMMQETAIIIEQLKTTRECIQVDIISQTRAGEDAAVTEKHNEWVTMLTNVIAYATEVRNKLLLDQRED